MDRCAKCDAALVPGRFCMNCGHLVGEPVDPAERIVPAPEVLPTQAPSPTRTWTAVGAIATLVLVLVVVASCLGGGGGDGRAADAEDVPAPTPSTPTPTQQAPTPDVPHSAVTSSAQASASETATATRELDGGTVNFEAVNLLDAKRASAWRVPGNGRGVELTFTFAAPHTLSAVGLVNGWDKVVAGTDWYPLNRRVTKVVWMFDDGTKVTQTFAEHRRMQRLRLDPVTTTSVRLRIRTTTPPGEGFMGRDYTAISDVVLVGAPA